MNKISKKIVALVTMAAFVLTLVPAAAFAASQVADPDKSTIQTVDKNAKAYVGDVEKIKIDVNDSTGADVTSGTNSVYIWFEDEQGNVVYNVNYFSDDAGSTAVDASAGLVVLDKGYAYKLKTVADTTFSVKFTKAGTYTLKAGVLLDNGTTSERTDLLPVKNVNNYSTVTVTDKAAYVSSIDVTGVEADPAETDTTGTLKYTAVINGIDTQPVELTVNSKLVDGDAPSTTPEGTVISIENNNEGKGLYVLDNETGDVTSEVKVGDDQKAAFSLKADKGLGAGTYKIYLTNGDYKYTLSILVEDENAKKADTIEAVETATNYVATGNNTDINKDLKAAVQFQVKNSAGTVINEFDPAEPACTAGVDHDKYVEIVSQPEDSSLTAADVTLVKTDSTTDKNMTLKIGNSKTLVAGEYTIKVALLSGNSAEVSFKVAKFGEAQEIKIVTSGENIAYNSGTVDYKVVAVDEKGMEKVLDGASDYTIGVSAATGVSITPDTTATDETKYTDKVTAALVSGYTKDEVVGTKVTLTAVSDKYAKFASTDLTVVDSNVSATLEFDNNNGPAKKVNEVEVSVVDENGDVVKTVTGNTSKIYAYVASQSNESANVEVNIASADEQMTNGVGKISVYSDKETKVDVVVAVKDTDSNKIYAKTLTYTIGAEDDDSVADITAVMTIGSTDMIVNNEIVNGDAAPFVQNDRTYVPFRALGETFGAEVDWDQDAQTVTYTLGDTTVVMTIGETAYTINGEEKTMDVAPVLTGDRTYVPVRFVAEALGYKVTPLYAADGTTANVVFQK